MRAMMAILTGSLLLLGGCALSPQEITLNPDPPVPAANLGKNAPVRVTVVDDRANEAFGTRGGVYKDTALIRPANDISATVREIVRNGLQKQGFNVYNPPAEATELTVHIDTLSYVPESGAVVNRVTTRAVLKAVAQRPDVTHKASFRSKVTHEVPFTPDARRNEAMLTDVLSRSLERMLADARLLAFLAGSDNPDAAVSATNETPEPDDPKSPPDSDGQPPRAGEAGGS